MLGCRITSEHNLHRNVGFSRQLSPAFPRKTMSSCQTEQLQCLAREAAAKYYYELIAKPTKSVLSGLATTGGVVPAPGPKVAWLDARPMPQAWAAPMEPSQPPKVRESQPQVREGQRKTLAKITVAPASSRPASPPVRTTPPPALKTTPPLPCVSPSLPVGSRCSSRQLSPVVPTSPTIRARTRSIDSETEVPEELFERLAMLGREVRRGGQHVLVQQGGSLKLMSRDLLPRYVATV